MLTTESCPSGRRSTIGNRVGVKSVSRVQIPDSPPVAYSAARLSGAPIHPTRRGGRVVECGGLENRLSGNPGYEGSNPSSSARWYTSPVPLGSRVFLLLSMGIPTRRARSGAIRWLCSAQGGVAVRSPSFSDRRYASPASLGSLVFVEYPRGFGATGRRWYLVRGALPSGLPAIRARCKNGARFRQGLCQSGFRWLSGRHEKLALHGKGRGRRAVVPGGFQKPFERAFFGERSVRMCGAHEVVAASSCDSRNKRL